MRFIFYITFVFLILLGCIHSNQKTDDSANVSGWKIQACKMYSSDFEFLDSTDPGQLIQEFRFSRKGFVNELIRYGSNGEIIARFDITGQNNPFPMPGKPEYIDTLLNIVELDSLGNLSQKEVKRYNEKGFLVEDMVYNERNALVRRNSYKYNKEGMILEDIYWDIDLDVPRQIIRYKYEYFID